MRAVMFALVLAACGDGIAVDTTLEPTSGTRLKLEWYLFEDGTKQVEARTFYDTQMHARCEPRTFIDGTTRCLPFADDALYLDATCETAVGRAMNPEIVEPTHFIGYDRTNGELLPARVLAAGEPREPITEYYELQDDTCMGPFPTPGDLTYYTLANTYSVVAMHEDVVGGDHIEARMQLTDDGMRLPVELRDRARDAPCHAEIRTDGSAVCTPTTATPATLFGDVACTKAIVTVEESAPMPDAAMRVDPAGCKAYYAVGAPYTGALYEARGEHCVLVAGAGLSAFELGAPLDMPVLERTVEDEPNRRLQRIKLADGDFIVLDDRLYDSAIRADCRREVVDYNARCLPEATTPVLPRFQPGCLLPIPVAELPRRTCAPVAFAAATTEMGAELHAIGAPLAMPVFDIASDGQCRAYTAPADRVLHALGPPLGADAFVRGVRYGER